VRMNVPPVAEAPEPSVIRNLLSLWTRLRQNP
jgi:hypothetical protein